MKSLPRVLLNGSIGWMDGNSRFHREDDKPAYISPDGYIEYYFEGERHRSNDKPAVIFTEGEGWFYIHGRKYVPRKQNDTQT